MGRTLTKKLRDSGLATPESDRITQILAKEKSRRHNNGHQHKWAKLDDTTQYCTRRGCPGRRPTEGD
jgi:hypothetical protein